jgi:hypothetical protein
VAAERWERRDGRRLAWVVVIAGLVGYVVLCLLSAGGLWRAGVTTSFSSTFVSWTLERPLVTRAQVAAASGQPGATVDWIGTVQGAAGSYEPDATLHVAFNDGGHVFCSRSVSLGWPVQLIRWTVWGDGDVRAHADREIELWPSDQSVITRQLVSIHGVALLWDDPAGVGRRISAQTISVLAFLPIFLMLWLCLRLVWVGVARLRRAGAGAGADGTRRRRSMLATWITLGVAAVCTLGLMVVPVRNELNVVYGPGGLNLAALDTGLTRPRVTELSKTIEGRATMVASILAAPGSDDSMLSAMYLVPALPGTREVWSPAFLSEHVEWERVVAEANRRRETMWLRASVDADLLVIGMPRSRGDTRASSLRVSSRVLQDLGLGCVFVLAVFGVCGGPGWWLSRRDRRRVARGLCVGCGYDLSGLRRVKGVSQTG